MEGVQLVLEKIRDLLAPKGNFSIVLTSAGTDWTTHISFRHLFTSIPSEGMNWRW